MKYIKNSILVSLILVMTFTAHAAERTITFVYENYPPYEFNAGGTPTGIHVSIISKVCRKIGYRPIFINAPWKKAISMVKKGEVDAIFSLYHTKKRDSYLYFVERPLSTTSVRLFSRNETPEVKNFIDLTKEIKIGVVNSYTYGEKFDAIKGLNKLPASTNQVLAQQFFQNWVSPIIMNEKVFEYYEIKLNRKHVKYYKHPIVIQEGDLYVAFSKKTKDAYQKYLLFLDEYMRTVDTKEFSQSSIPVQHWDDYNYCYNEMCNLTDKADSDFTSTVFKSNLSFSFSKEIHE